MSNRERAGRLKDIRHTACGFGARALKLRLNKLAKSTPLEESMKLLPPAPE